MPGILSPFSSTVALISSTSFPFTLLAPVKSSHSLVIDDLFPSSSVTSSSSYYSSELFLLPYPVLSYLLAPAKSSPSPSILALDNLYPLPPSSAERLIVIDEYSGLLQGGWLVSKELLLHQHMSGIWSSWIHSSCMSCSRRQYTFYWCLGLFVRFIRFFTSSCHCIGKDKR